MAKCIYIPMQGEISCEELVDPSFLVDGYFERVRITSDMSMYVAEHGLSGPYVPPYTTKPQEHFKLNSRASLLYRHDKAVKHYGVIVGNVVVYGETLGEDELTPTPQIIHGIFTGVERFPTCDICNRHTAVIDASLGLRYRGVGPWGNLCTYCLVMWIDNIQLGTGRGQLLVRQSEMNKLKGES